ncbi:MYND-type domain-containing protein [Mycena venus]|uniref:MYND-type domain-containing protein n=1 Tax=Mycena venus TaxID=2733690 RepID=A0A8H7CDU2_9AGAR|nr:MYND-type domain-containing protein [Mycena venus]
MHPDLDLSNLAQLPLPARRIAIAACAPNHSAEDVERFLGAVAKVPHSKRNYLLPALYTLLDPKGIPSVEALDTRLGLTENSVRQIGDVLRAVYNIPFPHHLGPDLWPRVFGWVRFLHTYREQLPGIFLDESSFCPHFLFFAGYLYDQQGATAYMLAEPGLYYLVGRAWKYVLDTPEKRLRETLLRALFIFLADLINAGWAAYKELVDGVDGWDQLILLQIQYLSYFLDNREAHFSERDIFCLDIILILAVYVDFMNRPEGPLVYSPLAPFYEALRDRGVVPLLARAASALAETTSGRAHMPLKYCFEILGRIFSAASGHNWIPSAVENGLLRAIALSEQLQLDESIHSEADLLVQLIYVSLVYYHIPPAIDAALREIDVLVNGAAFKASKIYQKWQALVDLTQKRLTVVKMFDSPGYVPLKACDNLECAVISEKTQCQIFDWVVGGHKEVCDMYGVHCLNDRHPLTVRERDFLRALVHHDYSTSKSRTGLITRFNYTEGPVRITVNSKLSKQDMTSVEVAHCVARAGRSVGRLAPHVVRIADGRVTHTLLVPLRRSRADVETH